MFTDLSLRVALGRVPCSQISLYRSPQWVRSNGQLQCLPISLYRSPMAGTKLADLSLQTIPFQEDEEKNKTLLSQSILEKSFCQHFIRNGCKYCAEIVNFCSYMGIFVCYNRVFVKTEFVITGFDCNSIYFNTAHQILVENSQ